MSALFPSCRFMTRTFTSGNTAGCDPHGNRKLLKLKAGPTPEEKRNGELKGARASHWRELCNVQWP